MNCPKFWIAPLLALSFSTIANAAPVQYQIILPYEGELLSNRTQVTSTPVFSADAVATVNISYDPTTPATSTNNISGAFGPHSYYAGAITNFSGAILGHSFYSPSGDAEVYNSHSGALDNAIMFTAGGEPSPAGHLPLVNNFQGFTAQDFTLIGATIAMLGPNLILTNQSLPQAPIDLSLPITAQLILTLRNSAGDIQYAYFLGSNITSVPLSNSALFFLSGLIGLGTNKLRKLNR
jgi:hypothetical protein